MAVLPLLLLALAPLAVAQRTQVYVNGCTQSSSETVTTACTLSTEVGLYIQLASACTSSATSATVNAFSNPSCTGTPALSLTVPTDNNFYAPYPWTGTAGWPFRARPRDLSA